MLAFVLTPADISQERFMNLVGIVLCKIKCFGCRNIHDMNILDMWWKLVYCCTCACVLPLNTLSVYDMLYMEPDKSHARTEQCTFT